MDRKQNARGNARAKNTSDSKSKTGERTGQARRLPLSDEIKRGIPPIVYYRRRFPDLPEPKFKSNGYSQNMRCPFHEDPNGSFGYHKDTGAARCFGCGFNGGSVIDTEMKLTGADFDGARASLAADFGLEPGPAPASPSRGQSKPATPRPNPVSRETPAAVPAPMAPIPPEALETRPKTHYKLGAPSATWEYRDATGRPLCFQNRFDRPNKPKLFQPQTWTPAGGWQWKGLTAPWPMYGLDRRAARPEAPVLIAEGEKDADAAGRLLPGTVAMTTMNGAGSPGKSDLGPLAGGRLLIWPDNDKSGAGYAAEMAELAQAAGASSVSVLDLSSLARDPKTGEPRELPNKWGAADAEADGWTAETLAAAVRWVRVQGQRPTQPAPVAPEDAAPPLPFELRENGIYCQRPGGGKGGKGGDGDNPPLWICPPMRVLAVTRDDRGEDFGRLVDFHDLDKRPRRLAIMDRERQGSGDALRARLAAAGFETGTNPEARRLFLELLRRWTPAPRARSTTCTGWTKDWAYVSTDRVLGEGSEPVILAPEGEPAAFGIRGGLEPWRNTIAWMSLGNSRLVFVIACAFAPPLLHLIGAESGGFHLKGASTDASSSGKTTAQRVAASVCGSPDYLQRWRTTDNALEGLAELHNDGLLILDELNQMDPKAAGEAAYMLANGTGKARMDRNAGGRPVKRWRLLFLSSGEIGLAEHMATAQRRIRAGQETRMAEIPADAGKGLGLFEDLHGYPDGAAFALALTDAAAANYGTPFVAFVEALIRERARLPSMIKKLRDDFVFNVLGGIANPPGQVRRVAQRFGLVAVAGELATDEGITGWPSGEAFTAAERCFRDWLKARGGAVPAEQRDLLAQVRLFFEQHANRFRWKDRALDDHAPEVPKQAGFKDMPGDGAGGIVYYAFPETFRREIVEGYDPTDAARVLVRCGLLKPSGEGRPSRNERLPGFAQPVRVYVFASDMGATDGP